MPLGTRRAANSPPCPPLCEGGDPSEDDADSFEHASRLKQGFVVGEDRVKVLCTTQRADSPLATRGGLGGVKEQQLPTLVA